MRYIDRVYGEAVIDEPVIVELINSPSLQRLRRIDLGGHRPHWAKQPSVCHEEDHSRFAHSVGVYLLLRRYGASLEEQVAGLLHDVSHSAFSHCIDYVLQEGSEKEQSHQDAHFDSFVRRSELPAILHKYGMPLDFILDDTHFPLKERELPDLCADRIDYSLRSAIIFEERSRSEIDGVLSDLQVGDGRWFFTSYHSAKRYAELFLHLNRIHWSGLASAVMFRTVGDCLKYALKKKYISQEDLYTTDQEVLLKLEPHRHHNSEFSHLWLRMNNQIKAYESNEGYESEVFCKSRVVDPLWLSSDAQLLRVSQIDAEWACLLQEELRPKRYLLAFGSC